MTTHKSIKKDVDESQVGECFIRMNNIPRKPLFPTKNQQDNNLEMLDRYDVYHGRSHRSTGDVVFIMI